jgi:glutamate carboxypeptidase
MPHPHPRHPLLEWLTPQRDAMLAALRLLVEHESPSSDKPALDLLARGIEARLRAAGTRAEILPLETAGNAVLARVGPESPTPHGLVLGHFDTVWPVGTLASMPFRAEEGRIHGPGTFDMKASIVLVEFALRAIAHLALPLPRPIHILITADEEIGSRASQPLIQRQCQNAAYALVLESPLEGGRLKTARKGVGGFELAITGRAAHAGIEPEKGASAVVELAHQILAIEALARPDLGTTLNIGRIEGGTTANVVPAQAHAVIDARAWSAAEASRVAHGLASLQPATPGTTLGVTGGFNRPPMERTAATVTLLEQARVLGSALGIDVTEGSTGGGSDGNFTAAAGVPTLDGLGCEGAGAHAAHEHILARSLPERAAFLAALLLGL